MMSKKTNWKNTALQKQLAYRNKLGLTACGKFGKKDYDHILSDEDAKDGKNFYCFSDVQEWEALQDWVTESRGKKVNFMGTGMKNLLRSEHIPYNFFYPLEKIRKQSPNSLNSFLTKLCRSQIRVDKVNHIKIEYAGDYHKNDLLSDNTSFDIFIEYQEGGSTCGLGIEVKYTEKSYPFGVTEKERMADPESIYNKLSKRSRFYKKEMIAKLRTTKLKQAWRNHLLGIKLTDKKGFKKFHSVHLYPEGNTYQYDVCKEYMECLNVEFQQYFIPITFEWFVETAEKELTDVNNLDWLQYLKDRY